MTIKRSLKVVGLSVMLIFFPWLKGIAANHDFMVAYELESEKSVEYDADHEVTLQCSGIDRLHFFNCYAFRTAQNKEVSGALSKQARISHHCVGFSVRDEISFISMPEPVKNIGLAYGKEGQSIGDVGFVFEAFESKSKIKLMLIESACEFVEYGWPSKKDPALSGKESASGLEFLFFFEMTGGLANCLSGISGDGNVADLESALVHSFLSSIAYFGWEYTIVTESGKASGGNGVQRFFKLIVPIGCKSGQKTCCKHFSFMDDLLKFIPERSMIRIAENKNKKERGGKKEKEKDESKGGILLSSLCETALKKVLVQENGDDLDNKVFADGGQGCKSNLHEEGAGRDQCAVNDRCLLFFVDGYGEQNKFCAWIMPKKPAQLKEIIQKRCRFQQNKYQYMADNQALSVIKDVDKKGKQVIDLLAEAVCNSSFGNDINDLTGFYFYNNVGDACIIGSCENGVEKQGELFFDKLVFNKGFKRLSIVGDNYCFYHAIAEWIRCYAPAEKRESFFDSGRHNKEGFDGVGLFRVWGGEVLKKIEIINNQIADEEKERTKVLERKQSSEGLKTDLECKKEKLCHISAILCAKSGQCVWGNDEMIRQLVIPDMAPLVLVFTLGNQGEFQGLEPCAAPVLSAELFKDDNKSDIFFGGDNNDFMIEQIKSVDNMGGIILLHHQNHWSLVVPDDK